MGKIIRFYRRKILLWVIIAPLFLGFIGYCCYYREIAPMTEDIPDALTHPFLEAAYSTLRLYFGSTDMTRDAGSSHNICYMLVEVARFLAVMATGSVVFQLLSPYFRDLWISFIARFHNSMALHGSTALTEAMRGSMPSYRVLEQNGSPARMNARIQIVAFEKDEQALHFIQENQEALLSGKTAMNPEVYLCVHSPWLNFSTGSRVRISCMAENCARVYWEIYYLRRFSGRCTQQDAEGNRKKNKVLIFGLGNYGEAILSQALLVNVFLPDTPGVEYHVFGDGTAYHRNHANLPLLLAAETTSPLEEDEIYFHKPEDFSTFAKEYVDAERIILAEDDDTKNLLLFSQICNRYTGLPPIHIRLNNKEFLESILLSGSEFVPGEPLFGVVYKVFGTIRELYTEEVIIKEKLLERARQVNVWYGKHFQDEKPWEKLGFLEKHSNIAAADHFSVKIRQVLGKDVQMDAESHAEYKKKYAVEGSKPSFHNTFLRLEHKRWMRFYFLMGWTYSPEKNKALHQHNYLTSFCALDEDIQNLDIDSYKALCEIKYCFS